MVIRELTYQLHKLEASESALVSVAKILIGASLVCVCVCHRCCSLKPWLLTWGAHPSKGGGGAEFTAGVREQIYFEVGLGDKTMTIIIVI